jgi:propionyl-CoA carboxylase alpha chain
VPRFTEPVEVVRSGSLVAPLPGTVTGVAVRVGDHVAAGRAVITVEAMKMQHTLTAPAAGTVQELTVWPGQQIQVGTVLAVIAPDPEEQR